MSERKRKKEKSVRNLIPIAPRLIFYILVSAWLLTGVCLQLISPSSDLQFLSLEYARSIPTLPYLLSALIGIVLAVILLLVPVKIDKIKLGVFLLLASLWVFLIHLWFLVFYQYGSQSSFSYAVGFLLMSIILLAETRRFLLGNKEKIVLHYATLLIFIIGLVFFALNLIKIVLLLANVSEAELNLTPQLILTIFLAVQGALAGAVVAHLFPDVSIIKRPINHTDKMSKQYIIIGLALIIHIFLFGYILYVRTSTLATPTYDLGIFAQMFHNMATTGLPVTTLERSYELSHFHVHLSPVYYLLLPIYYLTRSVIVLQLSQIALVASGVIPLLLITRFLNWPKRRSLVFSLLYLTYPALSGSSMYDLHENFFLAPFLLWLLYFVLRQNAFGTFAFSILILSIKEDAAIYVVFVAIWILLSDRTNKKHGMIMLLISLLWFVLALYWLYTRGLGAMDSRFSNLMAWPEYGLPGVVLTSLLHPAYALTRIFTANKIVYILKMMLPLAFLPLLRRWCADHVLVLPWLIINLLSDYQYQHNINFQYHYGTGVLLIFVTLLAVDDMFRHSRSFYQEVLPRQAKLRQVTFAEPKTIPFQKQYSSKSYLALCIISGVILVSSFYLGASVFRGHYVEHSTVKSRQKVANVMKVEMDKIPSTASVKATTWLTTYLSNREKLIDLSYEELDNAETWLADYIVIDQRYKRREAFEDRIEIAISQGYRITVDLPEKILILQLPSSN